MSKTIEQLISAMPFKEEINRAGLPELENELLDLVAKMQNSGRNKKSVLTLMLIQKLENYRFEEAISLIHKWGVDLAPLRNSITLIDHFGDVIKYFGSTPVDYRELYPQELQSTVNNHSVPVGASIVAPKQDNSLFMLFVDRTSSPQIIEGTIDEAIIEAKNLAKNKDRKITILKSVMEITQRIDFEVKPID